MTNKDVQRTIEELEQKKKSIVDRLARLRTAKLAKRRIRNDHN